MKAENKKYWAFLVLIIIPYAIFQISLNEINDREKDWYGAGYDPSYAYLYNSLNVATFRLVGHFDHPGTPMQITGAVILHITWLIADRNSETLTEDVLSNPEYYLRILNIATAVISSLFLWLIAILLQRKTKSLWIALLFQMSPFISGVILYNGFLRTSQESMLMVASLAFAAYCLIWLFDNGNTPKKKHLMVFGIISGFGLASKMIFAPLILIPLMLFRNKPDMKRLLVTTIISFIIFTLPIVPLYPNMGWWVIRLFIHSGIYGTGSMTVVEPGSYVQSLKELILSEPLFLMIFIISVVFLISVIIDKVRTKKWFSQKEYVLILAIVLTQTLGFIITAKHPKASYLLPYECLSMTILIILFNNLLSRVNNNYLKYSVQSIVTLSLIITLFSYGIQRRNTLYTIEENNEYEEAWQFADKNGDIVIGVNPGPSPIAAAFFGNTYSKYHYGEALSGIYPKYYIFDTYKNKLTNFNGVGIDLHLAAGRCKTITVIGSNIEDVIPLMKADLPVKIEKFIPGKAEVGIFQCK